MPCKLNFYLPKTHCKKDKKSKQKQNLAKSKVRKKQKQEKASQKPKQAKTKSTQSTPQAQQKPTQKQQNYTKIPKRDILFATQTQYDNTNSSHLYFSPVFYLKSPYFDF
ncbi:hypothetical protein [Helicobacter sp. T3_23-1059]